MQLIKNQEMRRLIVRRILYALILALGAALQNLPFAPSFSGFTIYLVLPAVVCIAMMEQDMAAILLGAFGGALWDSCSGSMGLHALAMTAVAFGVNMLVHYFLRSHVLTALILTALPDLFLCLIYWVRYYVVSGGGHAGGVLLKFYLPSFLLTLAVTPLIFVLIKWIQGHYRKQRTRLYYQ